jgi:hypothetical protein
VCVCVYIYIYIYIHTHTHTHTHMIHHLHHQGCSGVPLNMEVLSPAILFFSFFFLRFVIRPAGGREGVLWFGHAIQVASTSQSAWSKTHQWLSLAWCCFVRVRLCARKQITWSSPNNKPKTNPQLINQLSKKVYAHFYCIIKRLLTNVGPVCRWMQGSNCQYQ